MDESSKREYLSKEKVLQLIQRRIVALLNGFGYLFDSVKELERLYCEVENATSESKAALRRYLNGGNNAKKNTKRKIQTRS